jgi:hypothetical protein
MLNISSSSSSTNGINSIKLGRWNLHYDPKIVHSKVDQANEDHCGCCHTTLQENQTRQQMQQIQKRKWQEKQQQQQRNYAQTQTQKCSESDDYYIPYFM